MKFIIQDLLDYSQIKAGKFRQNFTNTIDIQTVLDLFKKVKLIHTNLKVLLPL